MSDWTDFFLQRALTPTTEGQFARVAVSIFDTPEEVEKTIEKPVKPPEDKAEKKPDTKAPSEPPAAPPTKAPSEAPAAPPTKAPSEAPSEAPKGPGKGNKPSSGKWLEFLGVFYEKGKKKLKNPNPKTSKKYPEVLFTTAMKFEPFADKVKKEFEAWLQQGLSKPKTSKIPTIEEADRNLFLTDFKVGDLFWEKGFTDQAPVQITAIEHTDKEGPTLIGGHGEPYLSHEVAQDKGGFYVVPKDGKKNTPKNNTDDIFSYFKGNTVYDHEGNSLTIEDIKSDPYGLYLLVKPQHGPSFWESSKHLSKDKPKKKALKKLWKPGAIVYHKGGPGAAWKVVDYHIDPLTGKMQVLVQSLPQGSITKFFNQDDVSNNPPEKPEVEDDDSPIDPYALLMKMEKEKKEKALKPGAKLTSISKVDQGQPLTWDYNGQPLLGIVTKKEDGIFYVQSVDKDGQKGPNFIFDQSDLDSIETTAVDPDSVPEEQKPKIPPKPEKPEIPPKPEKPEIPPKPESPNSKPISSPSEAKVGDTMEWELNGKTYRGTVESFDSEGNFLAKIYWPTTSMSFGKSPVFDSKRIADLDVRIVDPKDIEKYDKEAKEHEENAAKTEAKYSQELKEHEENAAKTEAKYSQELKEWQQKKDALTTGGTPVHPTSKTKFDKIDAPSHWNPNSIIGRQADQFESEIRKQHGTEIKDLASQVLKKGKETQTPSEFKGATSEWEAFSAGEKALWALGNSHNLSELVGGYFTTNILSSDERQAWKSALSGWQSSSGSEGAHQLMGALEELGLKGGPKGFEATDYGVIEGRKDGRNNKALKSALAKAMAFSQLFYKSLGVKNVILYRGAKNKVIAGSPTGAKAETPNARELTSFSVSPNTAYNFGHRAIKYRVPVRNLFIAPITLASLGPPDPHEEAEYIVADMADLQGVVLPHSKDQIDDEAPKLKLASKEDIWIFREEPEDLDWIQEIEKRKMKDKKKKTAHKLLRLAESDQTFRTQLLSEMRRMIQPRDFAVEQEAQEVLLADLKADDIIRITFRTSANYPSVSRVFAVLFGYDSATRGVELATEGTGRPMLEDRGPGEGVVYIPSKGKSYPLLKIQHVHASV